MVTPSPPSAWRLRLADKLARGELTRLGTRVAARPDLQARAVLGAVLARAEVRAAVPPRLYSHWLEQHRLAVEQSAVEA